MIALSAFVQQLLLGANVQTFSLIEIGDYKTTDYYGQLTLSDGKTYLNDGRLIGYDPPEMTTSVDRAQYKISMIDPDNFFGAFFEENGYSGLPVNVRIGFINPVDNFPATQIENTILIYSGYVDSGGYVTNTDYNGDSIFTILCTSPMHDLDLVKTFTTSKDSYYDSYPNDNSFEQVYEGSGAIALKWGK